MNSIAAFARRWRPDFSLDLRSLAALRVGMALLLLSDIGHRLAFLVEHYTDEGVLPRLALLSRPEYSNYSLHSLGGSAEYQIILFGVAAALAVMLLLGCKTRLATFFSWLLLLSLHNRNPFVLHAGDLLTGLILFWGLFLPWGERFSMDARERVGGSNRIFSAGTMALILQIGMLYWFSIVHKLRGPEWREGLAVYYVCHLDMYIRTPGKLLANFPWLMTVLTYVVLVVEFVAPLLLVWPRRTALCRMAGILAIVLLHAGMGSCLSLGLFPWIGAISMLGFLPSEFWDRLGVDGENRAVTAEAGHGTSWSKTSGTALASFFIAYCFVSNLESVPRFRVEIPERVKKIFASVRIRQNWSMFAPTPMKADGWPIIMGTLENGSRVDLLWPDGKIRWKKPGRNVVEELGFHRQEYLLKGVVVRRVAFREVFSDYLVRKWNAAHGAGEKVKDVKIAYLLEKTPRPGQAAVIKKIPLYRKTYGPGPNQPR